MDESDAAAILILSRCGIETVCQFYGNRASIQAMDFDRSGTIPQRSHIACQGKIMNITDCGIIGVDLSYWIDNDKRSSVCYGCGNIKITGTTEYALRFGILR